MPISNSYPKDVIVEDADLFLGTKAATNTTVNYTAQGIANYLNINGKVSITGQMSFKFTEYSNLNKTISFPGGGGNNTPFASISQLIVSTIDLSGQQVEIFLAYLIDKEILLARQNEINSFGNYKITAYTVTLNPAFYTLDLEFIGGNGSILKDNYYDIVTFSNQTVVPVVPSLNEVLAVGNTTTNSISIIGNGLNLYSSVPIGGFTYNNQTNSVNAYFTATPTNPLIDLYRQNDFGSYGVFLQTNNSTYVAFTSLYDSNLNLEWSESGIGGSVNLTAGDSVSNGGKITFYDNDNFGSIRVNDITANVVLEFPNKTAGTYTIATTDDIPTAVTSVGLSMPSAFTVSNSPITGAGVIAVSGAGTSSQYIRGDGQLAAMPSGGGGGSSVNYYLNGSVASSVAGYQQLSNVAIIGGGTDFTQTGNGLIKQFLTDVGNPNRIEIPGGTWNFEMWFSMSSSGGTPKFYVELLKYNGTTFTTIANSSAVPETINSGTSIDLYLTSLAVPTTTLLSTDRLAIRVYIVNNSGGRTATLHTEDNHLCEILTTFSSGVTSLNGLTANTQYLATGTTGTDFNISSITDTHTFNLPDASATARGLITINGQTLAGAKTFSTAPILSSLTASQLLALDASKNIQSLNGTGLVKLTAGAISYDVNNYVKAIVKDAVQKTVTGAVGTIIISGYLIPANTFVAGDALKIDPSMFTRSGTSSMVISIYINSSLSLIGAARLAQSNTISATQVFTLFTRHYALDGTNLKGFPNILATSEIGANSNPMLSTPYDLTQDKYIIFTITPVNSADIAIQQYVNITN